jgi:hypothetical protein
MTQGRELDGADGTTHEFCREGPTLMVAPRTVGVTGRSPQPPAARVHPNGAPPYVMQTPSTPRSSETTRRSLAGDPGASFHTAGLWNLPFKDLVEQACADADMTLRLYHRLQGELRTRSLEEQFVTEAMALLATLSDKECDGIKVSREAILRIQRTSEKEAAALRNRAMAEAGREFSLDSKEELTGLLRERGLLRDGAERSVTRLELEQLACGHSIPRLIVRYQRARRRVKQLEAVSAQIKSGRLFPLFSQISSDHGCLSWADPPFSEGDAIRYRCAVVDKTMRQRMPNRETALAILERATRDPTLRRDRKKGVWPLPDGGAPSMMPIRETW